MTTRNSHNFADSEGSRFCQSQGIIFLPIRRDPNPEGSSFCPFRGVSIRRGLIFANLEDYQSKGVLFLPTRRGPNAVGSCFFGNSDGCLNANPERSKKCLTKANVGILIRAYMKARHLVDRIRKLGQIGRPSKKGNQ